AIPQGVTNLTIASYGAAIMAIAKGITSFEEVILGVITGKVARHPEFLRDSYGAFRDGAVSAQEIATIEQQLQAVEGLNNYNPAPPIRIDAFCSKPENSYLRQTSLCSN